MKVKQVVTPFLHEFFNFRRTLVELHFEMGDCIAMKQDSRLSTSIKNNLSLSEFTDYNKDCAEDGYQVYLNDFFGWFV